MSTLVEWDSNESHVFLNPRMPAVERNWVEQVELPNLPAHIWLASSGTTAADQVKLIALSKQAFLCSAQAVNEHLCSDENDIWLNVLPEFHVGGLSIYARAHLSGAGGIAPSDWSWDPKKFVELVEEHGVTLASLVPAQVYDLVSLEVSAPESLRALLVGGGAMREGIYVLARKLGWPVLPSYGLTEACSQVATAPMESLSGVAEAVPSGKILSHLEVKLDDNGVIAIKGDSILTGAAVINSNGFDYLDPKEDGWLVTSDIGQWDHDQLQVLGRKDQVIKVGGELVNLNRLNHVLHTLADDRDIGLELMLVSLPSERLGQEVALIYHSSLEDNIEPLIQAFSKMVHPFEKVRARYAVEQWPKTALGKIRTGELVDLIRSQ